MTKTGALLPYALAAAAVVVASAIALGATLRPSGLGSAPSIAAPTPSASGTAGLSESARMAYWRKGSTGLLELWASDLDGGRRWRIATTNSDADVALTRWSPDGGAVAYTLGGARLDVARLDGYVVDLAVPAQLRADRWKVVSFEWSPDGTRVAATFRAGGGLSNESDVYVARVRAGSEWERATTLGDAFAGQWIGPSQLFVETASGMIATLDLEAKTLRPITAMPATSPMIGRDGRVYFVGGRSVGWDVTTQPFASGSVWSATIDGDDLRREVKAERDQIRLFGVLADGRAVVGVPGGVYVAGDALAPLAFQAGTIRRVVVSQDGRRAIGLTDSRIVRIDMSKVRSVPEVGLPPADAASVVLQDARAGDVWFPARAVALARTSGGTPEAPRARLAFALGRSLWEQRADGSVRQLVAAPPQGWLGAPVWSPSGDRIAVAVSEGPGPRPATTLVVLGAAGEWRTAASGTYMRDVSWSSDGTQIALTIVGGDRLEEWMTQLYDAATGRAGLRVEGRGTWAGGEMVVLTDGAPSGTPPIRVGQRIELVSGASRTTISDADRLAADPLLRDLPGSDLSPLILQIIASGDGRYLGAWVFRASRGGFGGTAAFVVVRATDGEPVWVLPFSVDVGVQDVAWSPSAPLVARTRWEGAGPTAAKFAVVTDPLAGRTVLEREGRFAGWAPDGEWVYVARNEGLFAYRLDGSGPVRVGPFGVPVVATRP